jgi:archaellum biogenesis ATPase FlaH
MLDIVEFEKVFYLYTLENPKYFKSIKSDFFENEDLGLMYRVSQTFFERFKEAPTKEQLKLLTKDPKFKERLTDNLVDLVFNQNLKTYDEDWVKETTEAWVLWKNLDKTILDTIEYVKTVKVTPQNIKDIVNKTKGLFVERNSIVFDESLGLNFFDPDSHKPSDENKITSTHSWVDQRTAGGYTLKSLVVYAGEQNIGKSIWLANDAVRYIQEGHDVAFISAEMADSDVVRRLGSNLLNVAISKYRDFAKDPAKVKKKLAGLSGSIIPPGNLYVKEFPTSQATVPDLEAYLRTLEDSQGIKLKVIVVDYINILANHRNPNSENTYMKIKQIAEDLRAMAQRNEWLIITATQINRSGYDSSEITMGNIAESAGLSHTADVMYGIIQDSSMHLNNEYWLKLMKMRNGQGKNSKCRYTINYEYMRLSETDEIVASLT